MCGFPNDPHKAHFRASCLARFQGTLIHRTFADNLNTMSREILITANPPGAHLQRQHCPEPQSSQTRDTPVQDALFIEATCEGFWCARIISIYYFQEKDLGTGLAQTRVGTFQANHFLFVIFTYHIIIIIIIIVVVIIIIIIIDHPNNNKLSLVLHNHPSLLYASSQTFFKIIILCLAPQVAAAPGCAKLRRCHSVVSAIPAHTQEGKGDTNGTQTYRSR